MKIQKVLALILALAMVLSLAACVEPADTTPTTTNPAPTDPAPTDPAPTDPATTDPAPTDPAPTDPIDTTIEDGNVSVTFDDGNFGFVTIYDGRANADASTLEVVEVNGNNVLKVTNGSGKVPYVAIDVWSLLGENAANVASIEMLMGIENPDGKFYACSGSLILWTDGKLSSTTHDWSVYLQKKNPKVATFALADYEAFSAENSVAVLTLSTDNGATAGAANANLLIYNISFKDASGNVLTADTTATFAAPEGFSGEKDMSNLKYLKNTVSFDAMSGISGGAWGQNGVEMPEEFLAALVPGSVIEIEYATTSATGDLWIVMPWAEAGWIRVAQQSAAKNNSLNICQITYEEIAALCGEDTSKWGAMFQCESDGDWQVYSVKVGQDSGLKTTIGKTALEGAACTGTAWGQNGFSLTEEQVALLKAGCVIEIEYSSTSGDMWIVLPDAAAGWTRIEMMTAACNGSVCQITFEQIAAVLGDDVSAWFGAEEKRLQFEASGDWEVYAASICSGVAVEVSGLVDLGIACTGTAWGQNGANLTEEQMALLVPGSVITIKYNSTSGDMWIVLPDAAAGWTRIEMMTATCDGETCWIPFEQIAAVLGDDVSQWFANDTRLQFEASGDWEVYSVAVGTGAGAPETPDDGGEGTDEPVVEIPVPEIPAVPEGATELYSGTTALTGWQQVAQVNTTVWGGTIDPATFTDGGYFSVYFTGSEVFSVHFCFNGAAWVQLDLEIANATDLGDGTYVATFQMSDLLAAYGTDLSGLGAVMIYSNSADTGYAIVTLVTYTPAA